MGDISGERRGEERKAEKRPDQSSAGTIEGAILVREFCKAQLTFTSEVAEVTDN